MSSVSWEVWVGVGVGVGGRVRGVGCPVPNVSEPGRR